jgi:hypothetical protein
MAQCDGTESYMLHAIHIHTDANMHTRTCTYIRPCAIMRQMIAEVEVVAVEGVDGTLFNTFHQKS